MSTDDWTRVLVVDRDAPWWHDRLAERVDGVVVAGAQSYDDVAPGRLADAEVLVSIGAGLTADMVGRMPKLAWVQLLTSGHDHVGDALAKRPDVTVTTARGIHAPQMSELALLLMLMLVRGGRRIVEQQREAIWEPWRAPTLASRTVAVVGLGSAGRRVARACQALGMTVVGVSRSSAECPGVDEVVPRESLRNALARADFVVLTAPATGDGTPLVGPIELRAMKSTAFLVNLGRGSLVDEAALVEALAGGAIAGAGLDVFAEEPLPQRSPLWEMSQVILTPHIGGRSEGNADAALPLVAGNLDRFLARGREGLVNVVEGA